MRGGKELSGPRSSLCRAVHRSLSLLQIAGSVIEKGRHAKQGKHLRMAQNAERGRLAEQQGIVDRKGDYPTGPPPR